MTGRKIVALNVVAGVTLAVFASLAFWPRAAEAVTYNITVTMTEAASISTCNPNPPPSGGGGTAMVTYDDATNLLSWSITFQNLSGPAIAAHFHGPAVPASDAGIKVTIDDLTSPSVGSITISEADEAELLGGDWYINYHTSMCPGGEIRGQVSGNGIGGVTELADVSGTPLLAEDTSGANAGLLAALGAAIALAVVAFGVTARYAWKRVR
jgi:hypothetical protein